jgi:hypothetical protein
LFYKCEITFYNQNLKCNTPLERKEFGGFDGSCLTIGGCHTSEWVLVVGGVVPRSGGSVMVVERSELIESKTRSVSVNSGLFRSGFSYLTTPLKPVENNFNTPIHGLFLVYSNSSLPLSFHALSPHSFSTTNNHVDRHDNQIPLLSSPPQPK